MRQKVYNSSTSTWEYVDSSPVVDTGVVQSSTTARLTTGPTAPASPSEGDVWVDTSPSALNVGDTAVGINKVPTQGALDVAGDIYSNGEKVQTGAYFYNKVESIQAVTVSSTTPVTVPSYSLTVDLEKDTLLEVDFSLPQVYSSVDAIRVDLSIWEGSVCYATAIDRTWSSTNGGNERRVRTLIQAAAGSHTYVLKANRNGTGSATITFYASNTSGAQYAAIGLMTARAVG